MTIDRIALQNREFDAARHFAKKLEQCLATPVVDDDYPEMRHYYEAATYNLLRAFSENGRSYLTQPDISVTNWERVKRRHRTPNGLDVVWSINDWALALAGETGELCNVLKKMNRVRDQLAGNKETAEELRAKLFDEIADVFLYLDLLATAAGVRLDQVVRDKFNRKSEEMGFPERL